MVKIKKKKQKKNKKKTTHNTKAGENVEQQKLSFIAVRMQNVTITLEGNSAISYKAKHYLTM